MYSVLGLPGVVTMVSTAITPLNSARAEAEVSVRLSEVMVLVGWRLSERGGLGVVNTAIGHENRIIYSLSGWLCGKSRKIQQTPRISLS